MSEAYTGGCACGAIRYEISAEPVFMNHCQCLDCQRRSGTGHGSYLTSWASRREARGKATHCEVVGRQRQCQDARLLSGLRVAGLSDIRWPCRNSSPSMPASLDDPARYKPQVVTLRAARSRLGPSRSGLAEIRQDAAEVNA